MEKPITYLALSQLGATFFGMLFAAAGVKIWTRTFPDWNMSEYPLVVHKADWFAHYGLLYLIPTGIWLLFSLLVSRGRITLPFGDKWLFISGAGYLCIIISAGFGSGLVSIIAIFQ